MLSILDRSCSKWAGASQDSAIGIAHPSSHTQRAKRPASAIWLVVLSLAAFGVFAGRLAAAEEFESENTATSVRPVDASDSTRSNTGPAQVSLNQLKKLNPRDARRIADISKLEGHSVYVTGIVHSVYRTRSGTPVILNLGRDHRSCFKIVMFADGIKRWPGGVDALEDQLANRVVVVDGEIQMYDDLPQIVVNVPHQLRLVKE